MSLVPFAPAPTAPAGSAVLGRPSPPRTASPAGPSHTVSRGHGVSVESRPAGPPKGKDGFASVLDSVQQEVQSETAAADSPPIARERLAGREPRGTVTEAEPDGVATATVVPPPADERPVVPPATSSWLLLALEHGTLTRADAGDVGTTPEAEVETPMVTSPGSDVPVAPTPAAPLAPGPSRLETAGGAAAPTPAQDAPVAVSVPGTDVTPAPAPMGGAAAPAVGDAAGRQGLTGALAPADAVAGRLHAPAVPQPDAVVSPASMGLVDASIDGVAEAAQSTVVGEESADDAAHQGRGGAPSDASSRQLPGGRLSGPAIDPSVVAGAVDGERGLAPGLAVSRLAQHLGRQAHHAETGGVAAPSIVPPAPAESPAPTNASTPRVMEVLLRLAQAGGSVPPRSHDGGEVVPTFRPGAVLPDALPVLQMPVTAAPAVTLPPAVGEQVTSQIVSSLKMQWKDGIGEAKLHLRPDALGQVSVTLRVEQGAVTAVVKAESAQVQEWVLQHQQTLRQQLQDAGLRLDELTVNPDGEQAQQGRQESPDEERDQRSRRQSAPRPDEGHRFEQLL